MPDPYASFGASITMPADNAVPLLPHDTDAVAQTPKALFVGTGGHIVMRGLTAAADTVFRNVPSGTVLPFRPAFVRATGTTAADLLALY